MELGWTVSAQSLATPQVIDDYIRLPFHRKFVITSTEFATLDDFAANLNAFVEDVAKTNGIDFFVKDSPVSWTKFVIEISTSAPPQGKFEPPTYDRKTGAILFEKFMVQGGFAKKIMLVVPAMMVQNKLELFSPSHFMGSTHNEAHTAALVQYALRCAKTLLPLPKGYGLLLDLCDWDATSFLEADTDLDEMCKVTVVPGYKQKMGKAYCKLAAIIQRWTS